jgi:hypothetical protein
MDEIFSIGQFFWLMFLGCGGYLAFVYAHLADVETAKTVSPDRAIAPAAPNNNASSGLAAPQTA